MTAEEIVEFFAPHQSTTDAVTEWLVSSGISADRFALSVNKQVCPTYLQNISNVPFRYTYTNGCQWIQFDAPVAEVEELLFAEFFVWEHSSGTHDISTESYHLPTHIKEHIDYITPGTRMRQRNVKGGRSSGVEKRLTNPQLPKGIRPLVTQLPAFPHPNLSTCDTYVTAECTRSMSFLKTCVAS